jgi:hypothetical protein
MTDTCKPPDEPQIDLRDLLNAQTGRVAWSELQRHFARGMILIVSDQLDLIEVAARIIDDDATQVQAWIAGKQLLRAELRHAQAWETAQSQFWSVVAAPWVLVQEIADASP